MQFFEKGRVAFEAICKHAFFILHMGFPIKVRWEMLPVHTRPSTPARPLPLLILYLFTAHHPKDASGSLMQAP